MHITEQKKIFTVIKKRTKNDVWKNLYDFPLVETSKTVNWKQVISNPSYHNGINTSNINFIEASDSIRHKLTHQHIYAKFFHFKIKRSDVNMNEAVFTDFDDILKYPMPKLMENYIVSLKEKMKYF